MLVSTKGRYALRIMVDMAEHAKESFLPLRAVAERQGISEKYLESIAKILTQAGLLIGVRGKHGGYRLARRPEEYPVGEILRLTEGGLSPVACMNHPDALCPRREECRTFPLWEKLDELVGNYLDHVTIADLMKEPEEQNGIQTGEQ